MYIITKKNIEFCRSYSELEKALKYYISNNIVYKLTALFDKVEDIKKELSKTSLQA